MQGTAIVHKKVNAGKLLVVCSAPSIQAGKSWKSGQRHSVEHIARFPADRPSDPDMT
jgi:hypothetical protein